MKLLNRLSLASLLFVFLLALGSCDRDRAANTNTVGNESGGAPSNPPPNDPPPVVGEKRVRLYLFAAGFCGPCKKELPVIRDWLATHMSAQQSRILPLVVYIAGNPASVPAKQEDAEQFKRDLQIPFPILADKFGREYYRDYYPSGGLNVPAIVLLKEDLSVVKVYAPAAELNLDQLAADINEALK